MGAVQTGTLVKRKLIWRLVGAPLLALVCATASTGAALAHQPFFENPDTTASTPIPVKDPAISTALFATLERPGDVDFYMFTVAAGRTIEIGMTIPQIAGQEEFAPSVGVIAAGLDSSAVSELPEEVRTLVSTQTGATVLDPVEASFFFEPFSRTAYWRRQRQTVTFPVEGTVFVVVCHAASAVGRYTLVVGQREVPGGESGFGRKLKEYWTPVKPGPTSEGGSPVRADADATPTTADTEAVNESGPRCSWLMRLLAALIGASELCQ